MASVADDFLRDFESSDEEGENDDYVPGLTNLEEREQEMMDKLEYEGMPKNEAERRRLWLSFPREARAAVRRFHHVMDHAPRSVLTHILKGYICNPSFSPHRGNIRENNYSISDMSSFTS